MACTCVVGLQWGDEAKGKIVDLLTPRHDVVVRYNGGANAGHTVVTNGLTYKLSYVPPESPSEGTSRSATMPTSFSRITWKKSV